MSIIMTLNLATSFWKSRKSSKLETQIKGAISIHNPVGTGNPSNVADLNYEIASEGSKNPQHAGKGPLNPGFTTLTQTPDS